MFDRLCFQIAPIKEGSRSFSTGFIHVDSSFAIQYGFLLFFCSAGLLCLGKLSDGFVVCCKSFSWECISVFFTVKMIVLILLLVPVELFQDCVFSYITVSRNAIGTYLLPIPMPGYVFALGYSYTLYGIYAQRDRIGHTAHFGGALGGIILAGLWEPQAVLQQPLILGAAVVVCLGIGILMWRRG